MADQWPVGLVIPMTWKSQQPGNLKISDERREFLLRCSKYAAVTPPAMALLLAVSAVPEEAEASSWHHREGNGGAIEGARDASDLVNPLMGKLKKEPE
jgi:hypothetical protein